jgi:hypothetical protein
LKIVSYKDLYDWTMDDIVEAIGLKSNCTFCGVFRRQVFWNTNQSNENINVIGKLNNKIKLLFVRFLKCPAELKNKGNAGINWFPMPRFFVTLLSNMTVQIFYFTLILKKTLKRFSSVRMS